MSAAESFTPTTLTVTERAITKLRQLKAEDGNDQLKLRVYITGGGCSGFQYNFDFAEEAVEDDTEVVIDDVIVLVDALSYPYLVGAELDYQEGLEGSRFFINNPNAQTTCGCGASFSI